MSPDNVFRKMVAYSSEADVNRRNREESAVGVSALDNVPRQTVYISNGARSGTYRMLMRSHDRMGTRHLT